MRGDAGAIPLLQAWCWRLTIALVVMALPAVGFAQAPPQSGSSSIPTLNETAGQSANQAASQSANQVANQGGNQAAARGRNLFTGSTSFRNGGPSCSTCHTTAGLSFPGGGSLGPNLAGLYNKLGPVGMKAVLHTLYFPPMTAIYTKHPLEPAEQADLLAFFQQTAKDPMPSGNSGWVFLFAILLAILYLAITAFLWRKRVLGVRARLVARATAELRARNLRAKNQGAGL